MLDKYLIEFHQTGVVSKDVPRYLESFSLQKTASHCEAVAVEAKSLAIKFDGHLKKAEIAGFLHDISAVIPNHERIEFAQSHQVEVLAEEAQFPMIIHQKLSVILAKEIFGIRDREVLSAIGCHTTLKGGASLLDKIVFLADKMAWDQDGTPPYMPEVIEALEYSLDAAVLVYINYLWLRRNQMRVIHPWLIDAREYLMNNI